MGVTQEPSVLTCDDVPSAVITTIATDLFGNVGTCETVVAVFDNVVDDVECSPVVRSLDANGVAQLSINDADLGSWCLSFVVLSCSCSFVVGAGCVGWC